MSFTHKLSRRLAQLCNISLVLIAATACKDGGPLGSDYGSSPEQSSEIVGLLASSDNPTVNPDQPSALRAVSIRADGRRVRADVSWDAPDGGELRDTVIGKVATMYFLAKAPGEYRLVSTDRGKRFRDTTRVTVPPGQLSASVVKLYVVPAVVSLAVGAGQQFFVYGQSATGDSVPVVATVQSADGGSTSGLYYTAGDSAGTFEVVAKMQGGPLADTALVTIMGKSVTAEPTPDTPPAAPDSPSTTEPAPYTPPVSTTPGTVAELPRVYLDTRYQAPTGRTIVVPAGGDFQAALNAASRGDVIELAAGATFTGNFVLPQKTGTGWITIRTATSLPPEGTRITPGAASSFAKVITPNAMPAIRTAAGGGASFYRLMGFEVGSTASMTYALVHIGDYDNNATTVDMLPQFIYLDRMWVHGTSTQGIQRCVLLNARSSAVVDSYLSDCHMKGLDTQAIVAWNGPGPFKVVNNYLEGAGENVMFGGADPRIQGLIPSDIEIRRNHFNKPLTWKTTGAWTVKNLFELKNSARTLVEDNIFENSWSDGQTGFAIVLKSINDQGGCTWCVTKDVTFRYNLIKNAPGGINIVAVQAYNGGGAIPAHRMDISHNVFENVGLTSQPGTQRVFQLLDKLSDIRIVHNSGFGQNVTVMFDAAPITRLVLKDNLLARGQYGVFGSSKGEGNSALAYYAPDGVVAGNVFVGAPASSYPAQNFYPSGVLSVGMSDYANGDYSLSPSSPYYGRATDGTSPGADVQELNRRLQGVR